VRFDHKGNPVSYSYFIYRKRNATSQTCHGLKSAVSFVCLALTWQVYCDESTPVVLHRSALYNRLLKRCLISHTVSAMRAKLALRIKLLSWLATAQMSVSKSAFDSDSCHHIVSFANAVDGRTHRRDCSQARVISRHHCSCGCKSHLAVLSPLIATNGRGEHPFHSVGKQGHGRLVRASERWTAYAHGTRGDMAGRPSRNLAVVTSMY
jgi:hypothetical protein